MGTYIVLSKVNAAGLRSIRANPGRFEEIEREIAAMDGKIVEHWATLGKFDFAAVVSAPDNVMAQRMAVEQMASGRSQLTVLPAIDMPLFIRLLGQTTETTGPYRWQISWWAQAARRILRYRTFTKAVHEACQPLTIEGREHLETLKGPAIFIANHSSHLDSLVLHTALPERFRRRLTFGSAADRWFLKGLKGYRKQGWYNSLSINTFPIKRGGGRSSLDYAEWLLDKKWSVMIFPEGTRSSTGRMGKFRHGVAILALAKGVPVVPVYMEGLGNIRPKGSREITPGPVTVAIGEPIVFPAGTEVPDATHTMYRRMDALRQRVHRPRRDVAPLPSAEEQPAGAAGQ